MLSATWATAGARREHVLHPAKRDPAKGDLTKPGRFCVSITHAKDNTEKATVGFVVANAAVGSDKETVVFLSTEGVRLAVDGYADDIHEEGFAPLQQPMGDFTAHGRQN